MSMMGRLQVRKVCSEKYTLWLYLLGQVAQREGVVQCEDLINTPFSIIVFLVFFLSLFSKTLHPMVKP